MRPDLQSDHRTLTIVHWVMAAVAVGQLWVMIPMMSGGPVEAGVPVAIAALVVTVGAMWYAGRKLTDKADGGPRLAFWGSTIRAMSTINIIVALVLIVVARFT